MLGNKRWMVLPLAVVLLAASGCTDSNIDDGDAPDVQLEVVTLDNPPITGTIQGTSCQFTVEDWSATLQNVPKNSLAVTSPFNDVTLIDVVVDYQFIDPTIVIPQRVIGLGDATIPANATNSVSFSPLSFDDLLANFPQIQGSTANLTMVFRAVTVEGASVSDTVYRQLFVETCSAGSGG